VQIINAAANHWKHRSQWCLDSPSKKAIRTIETIERLGVDLRSPYPVATMLHVILSPQPAHFSNLLPMLVQWRDTVREHKPGAA
jgi:hypothetical protein